MRKGWLGAAALAAAVVGGALSAIAWDRGDIDTFAVLPEGSTGPEGLTVRLSDGHVFVTTFGFNSAGGVATPAQLFDFAPDGKLVRQVSIQGASPHSLGLAFNPVTGDLIVLDFGAGKALKVDPKTGASSLFMTASTTGVPSTTPGTDPAKSGLNALTFDHKSNAYISDSFQGIIWTVGPAGGTGAQKLGKIWVEDALLTTTGVPPFGANGVEFNNAQTTMFVANTGNDQLIQIPFNNGTPGTPSVFTNSINGADGIAVDADDNIWVAANQADEIVVVDKTGKAIAKLGDFNGVDQDGQPHGLLFPASPAFSPDGKTMYVTNLALDLRIFGFETVDAQWAHLVQHYTVSKLRAVIPPFPDTGDDRRD